jgi:hypothetical protein
MNVDDNTIFATAASLVVAGFTALFGGIRTVFKRISNLEKCAVRKSELTELRKEVLPRQEFEASMERAEISRQELRESVVRLFDLVDEVKTLIIKSRDHHDH